VGAYETGKGFASIRRIYGPEKEVPGVLVIEIKLVAELST
jgi:hypothetical protein